MVPSVSVDPGKIVITVGPHCVPAPHNVAEGETSTNVSNGAYTNNYYEELHNIYSYRSNLGFETHTNEIPETVYFKYMHLRNVQALRFAMQCFGSEGFEGLEAYKGLWNGSDIKVSGNSQGGMQTLAVAALCPEVTEVNVVVPWFADVAGNTDGAKLQSTLRPTYRKGLSYMDSANFAKHIEAETVTITAGTCDTLCPMSAVQAIYNNLNANARIRFVQGMGHASTNTYPIESYQSKAYNAEPIYEKDLFYISGIPEDFADAFSAAWETINCREAVLFASEQDFLSAESNSKNYIAISAFGETPVNAESMEELEAFVSYNGITSYNAVFTSGSALSAYDKAVLELSGDISKQKFNLISVFEDEEGTSLARKIATELSGVVFGNQVAAGKELTVIGENGNKIGGIAVSHDVENFKAYPIITPAYALDDTGLDVSYSVIDGVGSYNVSGDGIDHIVNVFSDSEVDVFGNDRGFDYILSNNILNIYGNGKIEDSSYAWNDYLASVDEIVLNCGIDGIGDNAFVVRSGTKVNLPYTLLDISANAFGGKTDFSILGYEGSGAEELGAESFVSLGSAGTCGDDVYFIYKDGTLRIVGTGNTLVSGIGGYGDKASCAWYAHYNDITKAVIGENITTIIGRTFHYMPSLTTVEITENLKAIGGSAFEGGPALTTVYLKGREAVMGTLDLSYVTSIGSGAFNDCKKIKNIILSENLEGAIGSNTFQLCSGITELTIPKGVTSIGESAFGDASALRKLTVLGRNTVIFASAFKSIWTENLINKVKIVAYGGSIAHGLARSEKLVFENLESGKVIDYGASPAQFMTYEGYQVRNDGYNGLRSLFRIDKTKLPTFEDEGYEIYEYGTVIASESRLLKNGEELTISVSDDGSVQTLDYARLIPIYRDGVKVGKLITNNDTEATFACTVINFTENTFDKAVVNRGYIVLRSAEGDFSVYYVDYPDEGYRAVTLEQISDGLYESGSISEDCISYIHVQAFKKIRDDEFADDNEFDPDEIFP